MATATAEEIAAAPPFAVFRGAAAPEPAPGPLPWAIFNEGRPSYTRGVDDERAARGIGDTMGEVQRDDETAPSWYSDAHAAADALACGLTIVVLPDCMSRPDYARFYAIAVQKPSA